MSRICKTIHVIQTVEERIVCDRCGRHAPLDGATTKLSGSPEDWLEGDEFLRIDFVGGFTSVFGEDTRVTGDFCQHCLRELLGEWLRVSQNESI